MRRSTFQLIISVISCFIISQQSLFAVPAKQGGLQYTEPDGSIVELRKIGDERAHILLSTDGLPVMKCSDGFYRFADISGDYSLLPTSVRVSDADKLSPGQSAELSSIDVAKIQPMLIHRASVSPLSEHNTMTSRATSGGTGLTDDAFLGYNALKGLVILAQYTDVKFSQDSPEELFRQMLNEPGFDQNGATGSARDYFIDSSDGQFIPDFDVYGPVTLPHPMAYYGGNDNNGNDMRAPEMIRDACKGLDKEIDFAEYDIDGDGYVDNVFVFYAGYGEASYGSDDTVWPHQWALKWGGITLKLDGVNIDKYACSNELNLDSKNRPTPCGIGTFVHEFSHVLGLPDLYDTSGNDGGWTPAVWSVLDQGPYNNSGHTPPAYSIFERYALEWIDPTVVDSPACITLTPINTTNRGCIIPTSSPNEFFLLENRQQTGWDKYLPGHGMLIWHIDFNKNVWWSNAVNNIRSHNYVDIEEACGKWYTYDYSYQNYLDNLAGYAFPGTKGVTEFTDFTTPSMTTWGGKKLGLPITSITESDGNISFDVDGGYIGASTPVIASPAAIGDTWFEAAWHKSEGASSYILTVKADMSNTQPQPESIGFDGLLDAGTVLPAGWDFVNMTAASYTSKGLFGKESPSLKISANGSGVMSPRYDNDITRLSFWTRGVFSSSQTKIVVDGNINGKWQNILAVSPSTSQGKTCEITSIPEGVRQVRFTVAQLTGNIALDDISIEFSTGRYMTLPDYNETNVGDITSCRVDRLIDGVDSYLYSVCAVDEGGRRTAWSDEMAVILNANAGINDLTTTDVPTVDIHGNVISYSGQPGDRVILSDICGRIISSTNVPALGTAVFEVASPGIYILSSHQLTVKIAVTR